MTSNTQQPSKDWLKICVTNRAKSKIRAFVKEEQRKRSMILGKDLVEREFRKYGANSARFWKGEDLAKLMRDFGIHEPDEIFVRVGYGRLETRVILERLAPELLKIPTKVESEESPNLMQKVFRSAAQRIRKTGSLVSVGGMDDVLVYYAKCCNPIPGDSITGFISRGRGVIVHRSDCRKAFEVDQLRKVDVEWNLQTDEGQSRIVRVQVISQDMPGLLKLMSEVFSGLAINIENANVRTTRDRKAVATFDISVKNTTQLNQVILELQKIRGVIGVSRVNSA